MALRGVGPHQGCWLGGKYYKLDVDANDFSSRLLKYSRSISMTLLLTGSEAITSPARFVAVQHCCWWSNSMFDTRSTCLNPRSSLSTKSSARHRRSPSLLIYITEGISTLDAFALRMTHWLSILICCTPATFISLPKSTLKKSSGIHTSRAEPFHMVDRSVTVFTDLEYYFLRHRAGSLYRSSQTGHTGT